MKLNLINEAKLSNAQIRDVDSLIHDLQNLKRGDFKQVHRGYGRYHSIGNVISSLQNELYQARPLETYAVSPIITRLIEKYPESIKTYKNHFVIIDPNTGKPKDFNHSGLRDEKRKQEGAGDRGKSRTEIEMISMLRNRQGYRVLRNYINYLKKFGFSGTKGLDLTKLRLKMEHVTLKVESKKEMYAETSTGQYLDSFTITTVNDAEILKIEELIDTINEVQLAAETLGVEIDSAFVTRDGVLYTLVGPAGDTHEEKIDIDSEDIESVQDAYREINKAMKAKENKENE